MRKFYLVFTVFPQKYAYKYVNKKINKTGKQSKNML